jgi:hypothetical protein
MQPSHVKGEELASDWLRSSPLTKLGSTFKLCIFKCSMRWRHTISKSLFEMATFTFSLIATTFYCNLYKLSSQHAKLWFIHWLPSWCIQVHQIKHSTLFTLSCPLKGGSFATWKFTTHSLIFILLMHLLPLSPLYGLVWHVYCCTYVHDPTKCTMWCKKGLVAYLIINSCLLCLLILVVLLWIIASIIDLICYN